MANHTLVAVDLAKAVFEVAVSHHPGQVARQKRYSREQFQLALAQLPQATVVMEACGSAHFWARRCSLSGTSPSCCPRMPYAPTSAATRPTAPTPRGCSRLTATRRSAPSRSSP